MNIRLPYSTGQFNSTKKEYAMTLARRNCVPSFWEELVQTLSRKTADMSSSDIAMRIVD